MNEFIVNLGKTGRKDLDDYFEVDLEGSCIMGHYKDGSHIPATFISLKDAIDKEGERVWGEIAAIRINPFKF